jgi:hypothetical protein
MVGRDEPLLVRQREPLWWGEAPELAHDFRGGLDRYVRLDMARPIDAPSRGPALDHGSARVSS